MTASRTTRINARLPAESARKLAYLQKSRGESMTEVILDAIDRYYTAITAEGATPAQKLANAGLIACAEGPPDLSRSYKSALPGSSRKKS